MHLLYILLFLFAGFLGMYMIYTPIANRYAKTLEAKTYMQAVFSIFFIYAIGASGAYFLIDKSDFVSNITAYNVFVPLVLTAVVYLAQILCRKMLNWVILALCVGVCVHLRFISEDSIPFGFNIWAYKAFLILFFTLFCHYFYAINAIVHTLTIPSVFMTFGLVLLGILGAAPIYLAICASLLCGILCAYTIINLNEVKIGLNRTDCTVLAFLLANLFILDSGEISFTSCIIFTMIFWTELLRAVWRKFMVSKSGTLEENTGYFQALQHAPLPLISKNLAKVSGVGLFIGWFQLFSVNQYSLLIVSFLIIYWLNGSVENACIGNTQSLKEANKDFVQNIKQTIRDARSNIAKISEKKKEDK